jgi:hypothetical protein
VSEVVPRKNLLALLRVWIEATNTEDDAVLIMKLNASGSTSLLKLLRDLYFIEEEIKKRRECPAFMRRPPTTGACHWEKAGISL